MGAEYETQRTSKWTAQVKDVEITIPKSTTGQRARRIARMGLVDNAKDPAAYYIRRTARTCCIHYPY